MGSAIQVKNGKVYAYEFKGIGRLLDEGVDNLRRVGTPNRQGFSQLIVKQAFFAVGSDQTRASRS